MLLPCLGRIRSHKFSPLPKRVTGSNSLTVIYATSWPGSSFVDARPVGPGSWTRRPLRSSSIATALSPNGVANPVPPNNPLDLIIRIRIIEPSEGR